MYKMVKHSTTLKPDSSRLENIKWVKGVTRWTRLFVSPPKPPTPFTFSCVTLPLFIHRKLRLLFSLVFFFFNICCLMGDFISFLAWVRYRMSDKRTCTFVVYQKNKNKKRSTSENNIPEWDFWHRFAIMMSTLTACESSFHPFFFAMFCFFAPSHRPQNFTGMRHITLGLRLNYALLALRGCGTL